jgi:hypothetical protein
MSQFFTEGDRTCDRYLNEDLPGKGKMAHRLDLWHRLMDGLHLGF